MTILSLRYLKSLRMLKNRFYSKNGIFYISLSKNYESKNWLFQKRKTDFVIKNMLKYCKTILKDYSYEWKENRAKKQR